MNGADYGTVLGALQARGRFGVNLGLARTRSLLRELGHPERGLRGVLIGGTNGKGSVQALVAAILGAAGMRVGQTPKPHLSSYRERLVVAGEPIAPDAFASLVSEVLELAERVTPRHGPPTEFEVLTAAAFAWFARQRAEVAVVEVGLGGRLDATNAWDGGVAAITNVEWDHMDRLGPTLTAIGREKAAIIKRGDRAVSGASGPGRAVIRSRAARLAVPLLEVAPLPVVGLARDGLRLDHPQLGELHVALLGRHQAANVGVALGIVAELEAAGIAAVDARALRRGLEAARWPGRLELLVLGPDGRARPAAAAGATARPLAGLPDVVLDGAHNEAGAAALAAALDELRPSLSPGRPTLLLGVMGDKDVPRLISRLAGARSLQGARIVATAAPGSRAASGALLAAAWRADERGRTGDVVAVEPFEAALGLALGAARAADGPLIVAGSLYLVGAVRDRLGVGGVAP